MCVILAGIIDCVENDEPSVGRLSARRAACLIGLGSKAWRTLLLCCGNGSGNRRRTLGADNVSTARGQEEEVRRVFSTSRWTGAL